MFAPLWKRLKAIDSAANNPPTISVRTPLFKTLKQYSPIIKVVTNAATPYATENSTNSESDSNPK